MKRWVLLLALCLALVPTTCAGAEAATEETAEVAPEEATADASQFSGELYDFQIQIGDDFFQFPMTYADLTNAGWELDNDDSPLRKIDSNSYESVISFYKGENRIYADVLNLSINSLPLEECLIGGVTVETGDWYVNTETTPVTLTGGVTLGASTQEEILAAYGEGCDIGEYTYSTYLTYRKDSYEEVELTIDNETGVLSEIDMRNFVMPEGFDIGEVSAETPAIVASYVAPTALGDDLLSPVVEYCGDLYSLSAPVSAFVANGWEIDGEEGAYLAGYKDDYVSLLRNNMSVRLYVRNETENAVFLENCFVEEIEVDYGTGETLTLSDGTTLGLSREDVRALAAEKGYVCDESGSWIKIYKNKNVEYDAYVEFYFGGDGDAATSLTCHNDTLPDAQ